MESVTFVQIGVFIGCLIVLGGFALVIKQLFQRDPPLHKEYVSRGEHEAFVEKMDAELGRERGARKKIHEEIGDLKSAVEVVKEQNVMQTRALADIKTEQSVIKREIKEDDQAMHDRIGEVLTALGEIKGEMKSLNK